MHICVLIRVYCCYCCFLIVIFLFSLTFYILKTSDFVTTPSDKEWEKLRPHGGIIHYEHNYTITGDSGVTGLTELLIIIFSHPESYNFRNAIRSTWLTPSFIGDTKMFVVHKFLIEAVSDSIILESIKRESELFGDIILDQSYPDMYKGDCDVLKAISMIQWIKIFHPKIKGVLKTNDHTWINIDLAFRLLVTSKPGIYGNTISTDEKYFYIWHLPDELEFIMLHPIIYSTSYLIANNGNNLYSKMHEAISMIQRYSDEKIFITGLVAEKAQIKRFNSVSFNINKTDSVCQYNNSISKPSFKYLDFYILYNQLINPKLNCNHN